MMNAWSLPVSAKIGGVDYNINADFRDVIEIIGYLSDQSRPEFLRWEIAISLFYDGEIPAEQHIDAIKFLSEFISYGSEKAKPGPKLLDWNTDSQMIVADVNKVAGFEIRSAKFLHWWTFLSYFYGVVEGQLSTVISIRNKKRTGKKLEKWEQDFYRNNTTLIDMKGAETEEIRAEKDGILKYL